MTQRKSLVRTWIVGSLLLTSSVFTDTVAHASEPGGLIVPMLPSGCSTWMSGEIGEAWCEYGTGEYRAKVTCDRFVGSDYTVYGTWKSHGDVSRGWCNTQSFYPDDTAERVVIEKRE